MKKTFDFIEKLFHKVSLACVLLMTSNGVFAENVEGLEPAKGAIEWVTNFLVNFTLAIMALVIIMKLLQIQFAQREWKEVITPVIITSLVVAAKIIAPAIQTAMGSF